MTRQLLFASIALILGCDGRETATDDAAATDVAPSSDAGLSGGGIYGPGIAINSLANTTIDDGSQFAFKTSMRFRAEQASSVTQLVLYTLNQNSGAGYGAGNGGICRLTLEKDGGNGHPDGDPIWTFDLFPVPESGGAVIDIPDTPALAAGQIYHLCAENVEPNRAANYFSLDYAFNLTAAEGNEAIDVQNGHPKFMDDKAPDGWPVFAHLVTGSPTGSWTVRRGFLPIISMTYADGHHQGMGYMEASYGDYTEVGHISGSGRMVRERFTVSEHDRTVVGAGFKVGRTPGTTAPLEVTLEDSSGNAIDSFPIPASAVPGAHDDPIAAGDAAQLGGSTKWAFGTFSQPRRLQVGSTYNLRLSSSGTYFIWTNRSGAPNWNYDSATVWADGNSEYTTTGGSSWTYLGRVKQPGQNNLQMFMRTQ